MVNVGIAVVCLKIYIGLPWFVKNVQENLKTVGAVSFTSHWPLKYCRHLNILLLLVTLLITKVHMYSVGQKNRPLQGLHLSQLHLPRLIR